MRERAHKKTHFHGPYETIKSFCSRNAVGVLLSLVIFRSALAIYKGFVFVSLPETTLALLCVLCRRMPLCLRTHAFSLLYTFSFYCCFFCESNKISLMPPQLLMF